MKTDSGSSVSLWMAATQQIEALPLQQDRSADVVVVGAGIAGLSTAYHLSKQGKSVIVIDDGPIAGGESCRTTAHLASALDDRYYRLEAMHGERGANLAAQSHAAAVLSIETICSEEGIDCDFARVDGYLFGPDPGDTSELDRELEAAGKAGLAVERVARAPISSFDTGPCLRFARQAQIHPLRYLAGLVAAIRARGGEVYTGAHATSVKGGSDAHVETRQGFVIRATHVVVATNTPVNDRVVIHTKQASYRTYVIAASVPDGILEKALYWDTLDPYHYIRLHGDTLIVGGEDHKTGQEESPEKRFRRLEQWTRERFPIGTIERCWSGQILEPVDSLGFIGRNPMDEPNVYIATGDSGNGMTHGALAGILIADLIAGRPNEWATLYDPSRISLRAAKEFTRENLNVAWHYSDLLKTGDVDSTDRIRPGEGAVIRQGASLIAAHRDENGTLHELSAICPHLGCVVAWNSVEKSWDCPCHGSRFDPTGRVLNGPALSNLPHQSILAGKNSEIKFS